jgi:hypothetical protein
MRGHMPPFLYTSFPGSHIGKRPGEDKIQINIGKILSLIASHFTDICYERFGFIFVFILILAKGFVNGYHSDRILGRTGHKIGIADKSEIDSPGFLGSHQIGLVGCAP